MTDDYFAIGATVIAAAIFVGWLFSWLIHIISIIFGLRYLYKKLDPVIPEEELPGVSILKPLTGVDTHLKSNLETFFTLKYPKYELLFSVQDDNDPAILVVKSLIDSYPKVDAKLFIGLKVVGPNGKINNMVRPYEAAKYDNILISDTGIKMTPTTLYEMAHCLKPDVGLVLQMPYCATRKGFGAVYQQVYFGTMQARNCLSANAVGINCSTGMSSMLRRDVLDKSGGLAEFGKYLAEDFFIAEAIRSQPNDGFQEQLQLFENMGCRIDKSHSEYRAFQLSKLAIRFKCGQFSQGDPEIPSEVYVQPDYSAKGNDAYYKCRKCRMFLFHDGALTSHNIGQGESAFDWRSKVPASKHDASFGGSDSVCQRSLFVDPLTWMKGKINAVQGKLSCPKCDIKIGSYVWFGEKCPCGAWVAPAFHIDSGKVDKIPSQPVMPHTHTPAAMPEAASTSPLHPVHLIGDVAAFPAGNRPLGHNPLPERRAASSRLSSVYPVAAVHPRMASASGSGDQSPSAPQVPLSPESLPQPVQSMEYETGEPGQVSTDQSARAPDNRDLESGINSIHMDVDSI